ncbi:MAG: MaoC family dehydratase [Proteobacteria bacterium]|nr:MaoC family dehydratase [Pseudomonadota bacterium]
MSIENVRAELLAKVGQEVHVSDWMQMTQERINAFAAATGDFQWIHTDPERAAKDSPWRRTIAHGYLTMSLYPMLRGIVKEDTPLYPGVRTVINYGMNKLRFTNAVKEGAMLRSRTKLLAVEDVSGGLQITEEFTVELEGEKKPACIAEVLMRLYF